MDLPNTQLLDASPDAMIVVDQAGSIVVVNKQAEELFGYTRDQLLDREVGILLPERFRDHHPRQLQAFMRLPRVRPLVAGLELFGQHQNGDEFPIDISLSPLQTEHGLFVVSAIRDISEQKEAQRVMRISKERYRDLFENTSDLIQSINPDGSFNYVNPAWRNTLGYDEEDMDSLCLRDIVHHDDHAYCDAIFAKVLSGESVDDIAARFVAKNGTIVWVEGNASCAFDNKKPASTRAIFRDVTQRIAAERQLQRAKELADLRLAEEREAQLAKVATEGTIAKASRDRLARIVEDSINEIFVFDQNTLHFLSVNRAARHNLGYSMDELLTLTPVDIKPAYSEAHFQSLISPLREGKMDVVHFETVHERKDGTRYPVDIHLQYMRDETPPVFTAIVQDITERDRQLDNLRLRDRAMATLDVGVIITDARQPDNPMIYANTAIESMTGFSANELIGRNPRFLYRDDSDQPELDRVRQAINKLESVQAVLRNYKKDGTLFKNEVTISPVYTDEGNVTHFIGVLKDVTTRLETDARLLHAQKIDAIGQLSGGIAHDFNNLLNVITGNLEFLAMDLTEEKHLELLNEADSAAQMGARLTRRLLTFARQSQLEPIILNVNDHVVEVMALLQSTIGETITLSSSLAPALWPIRADPSEIENMVVNLAINARDAMPEGGKIKIDTDNVNVTEEVSKDYVDVPLGDYVKLSISDNGCGMTNDVKARIFEPFFTTKEPGKGTGLGLATIYGFVTQSGGHIQVDSRVGHGTTMKLFLPRYLDTSLTRAPAPAQPTLNKPTYSDARILVVEDNDMVRKVTVKRLRSLGFSTEHVCNGMEAVQFLQTHPDIDLVLTDVVMDGGLSGYDVARWVQKNLPDCKLLLTSGFSEKMAENSKVQLSKLSLLPKPYGIADLELAVSSSLEYKTANV